MTYSLSAVIFYQGFPSHCRSFAPLLACPCPVALSPAPPRRLTSRRGAPPGLDLSGLEPLCLRLIAFFARIVRVLILNLSPFYLSSRPSSTDDSSQFQELPVGFVGDATSTLNTGSRFYVPGVGLHDAGVKESNRDGNAHAAENRNKISSVAGSSTKSHPVSTPSASSPLGAGEFSEFYREPGLQMIRANWWQGLVAIYHPNAEIGNELVMVDIVHL
jgi:hypothetical protein